MFRTHNQLDKVPRLRVLLPIVLAPVIACLVSHSAAGRQKLSCKLSAIYDLTGNNRSSKSLAACS
jgi:hypothetical protein